MYDRHLAHLVDRSGLTLLEIGVDRGGSLRMWSACLRPDATIVGIDTRPACTEAAGENRFVRIGDQSDPEFLRAVTDEFGPFDVVVDDGSHLSSHQIASFLELYPHVSLRGGRYLVEDTATSYVADYVDKQPSFMSFARGLVDRLYEPYRDQELTAFSIGAAGTCDSPTDVDVGQVSRFCAETVGISFHDNAVVFEKGRHPTPVQERR